MCRFLTNIRVVRLIGNEGPKPTEVSLRMSQSSFSVKAKDKNWKIIYFQYQPNVSWKLWKAAFQVNSYRTMSNDRNFKENLYKVASYDKEETYHGTISETQYASGNTASNTFDSVAHRYTNSLELLKSSFLLFIVLCTHSIRGTMCICPEKLKIVYYLPKT